MTEQGQPPQGPGASGPGPDGSGFSYRGAEQELVVVARPEARLRAGAEGVRSAAGADVSALNMFLSDEQLALEPLFGSEERLQQSAAAGPEDVPDLALFYRVRGGQNRAQELRARIAALPGVDTAYVKPRAVPASLGQIGEDTRRLKEGAPVTPTSPAVRGICGPRPRASTPTGPGSGPAAPARA